MPSINILRNHVTISLLELVVISSVRNPDFFKLADNGKIYGSRTRTSGKNIEL